MQPQRDVSAPDDASGRLSDHVIEPVRTLVVAEQGILKEWDALLAEAQQDMGQDDEEEAR